MRNKLILGLFLMGSTLLFTGFAQVKNAAYKATLDMLLSDKLPAVSVLDIIGQQEIIFLDARKPEEYQVVHIPGAKWVGFRDFELEKLPADIKDRKIVVYCSIGYRSEKITRKLIKSGYTNVYNLYGGIFEWINREQTVVNEQGPTHKIHGYSKSWGIWLSKGDIVY